MTRSIWIVFCLLAGVAPAFSQQPPERVDRLLERLSDYGYAGAIAVSADGEVVHRAAYGLADRERGMPLSPDSRFDIGSLTKPFVAAVVLRLVEEGVLSVDDPLEDLLDGVPSDKSAITVHQLLTHTSGFLRSAAMLGVEADTPRDAFVATALASDLLHPPGERFEYSDTGYDLLAAIAEVVTGEEFEALLRRLVLDPAGLERTGYATDEGLGEIAPSYTGPIGVPWIDDREGPSAPTWTNRGSGGLVSTVGDLLGFEAALRDGRILTPASVERMTTGQEPVGDDRSYGYGWFVTDSPEGRLVYHGGDIAGYKAHLVRYVDRGVVFALLDNVYGWERTTDRDAIAAWFGAGPTPPPEPREGADLSLFEGTYRTPAGDPLVVWVEAGRVAVEAYGQAAVDRVFGIPGKKPGERTIDAARIIEALQRSDVAFIETRLRDRDRAAGMAGRLASIWGRMAERGGPVEGYEVLGSYPAQDGTVVSLVEVRRAAGTERLRLIWRGDRLVSAGGDEGLRRPTALFEPTGPRTAARFSAGDGVTTTLNFEPDGVRIATGDRETVARRDRENVIDPPRRSLVRTLLPVFAREGVEAGLARYERLRDVAREGYDFGEGTLNDLGYRLLHAGAVEAAIAVFERNVAEHPDSWNVHDSLGEAYLAAGRVEAGRESYARSLRLNPDNERAREVVGEGP